MTATEHDLSLLPLSIVTEVAGSRDRIRTLLDQAADPQLVIRLATAGASVTHATPRLASHAFVSRLPVPDSRSGRAPGASRFPTGQSLWSRRGPAGGIADDHGSGA